MAVQDAAGKLGSELGATPTVAQIAERTELTEEEVAEALQAEKARNAVSLDVPRTRGDEGAAPVVETVGTPEPGFEAVDTQLAAEGAGLDERERRVLQLRFEEGLNQYEIGNRLGVSQMQISRILPRALRKLVTAVQDDMDTSG
jgi:RNA polymerase sigma-B factor